MKNIRTATILEEARGCDVSTKKKERKGKEVVSPPVGETYIQEVPSFPALLLLTVQTTTIIMITLYILRKKNKFSRGKAKCRNNTILAKWQIVYS